MTIFACGPHFLICGAVLRIFWCVFALSLKQGRQYKRERGQPKECVCGRANGRGRGATIEVHPESLERRKYINNPACRHALFAFALFRRGERVRSFGVVASVGYR